MPLLTHYNTNMSICKMKILFFSLKFYIILEFCVIGRFVQCAVYDGNVKKLPWFQPGKFNLANIDLGYDNAIAGRGNDFNFALFAIDQELLNSGMIQRQINSLISFKFGKENKFGAIAGFDIFQLETGNGN